MYALLYIYNDRLSSTTAQMPNPHSSGTHQVRCAPYLYVGRHDPLSLTAC